MAAHTSWSALEQSPALKHVPALWRARLGAQFALFKSAFLQRAEELADCYPCPRDCGCVHEIVQEGPEMFVAVCRCEPWNCDDLLVARDELELWELNWSKLGRALCAGLGLDVRPAETSLPNTRQIGSWSTAAVPVLLTIQNEPAALRRVVAELGTRLRRPYILLAPTSRHLTAASIELLADSGAGFFDLESHVALAPTGNLQPSKAPGTLFSQFTPEPALDDHSVVERAFSLVKALDSERGLSNPSVVAVFSHYCLEGFTVSRIARKFGCSRGTVLNRLDLIRERTGTDPNRFRRLSPQIGNLENSMSDPRAKAIYRKGVAYGEESEAD